MATVASFPGSSVTSAIKSGVAHDVIVQGLRTNFCFDGSGEILRKIVAAVAGGLDNRLMAHERSPPPGYLEGFHANVTCVDTVFVVRKRATSLTDGDIVAHEAKYRGHYR